MGAYDSSKAAVRIMTEVLEMECRPFDIRVMLVVGGSIQTQIITKQDEYQLPPNSIYSAYQHNIRGRLETARDKSAMPAEKFAEEVVSKILGSTVPKSLYLGGKAFIARMIFPYLPRIWVLWIMWNMFSSPEKVKS